MIENMHQGAHLALDSTILLLKLKKGQKSEDISEQVTVVNTPFTKE